MGTRERASVLVSVGRAVDGAAVHVPLGLTEAAELALVETAVAELVAWSLWLQEG